MVTVGGNYSYRLSKKFKRSECKMNSSLEDTGLASRDFGVLRRYNWEWVYSVLRNRDVGQMIHNYHTGNRQTDYTVSWSREWHSKYL